MNRIFVAAMLAASVLVSACGSLSSINDGLRAAGTVVQLPVARATLFEYLSTDELVDVGPSLQLLDVAYTDAVRLLDERPDTGLEDLVKAVLGAPDRLDTVRLAFLSVESAVAEHSAATGEPVPEVLVNAGEGMRSQYASLQKAIQTVDRTGEAVEFLRLLRPLALALL